jgi:hypothetical protein
MFNFQESREGTAAAEREWKVGRTEFGAETVGHLLTMIGF